MMNKGCFDKLNLLLLILPAARNTKYNTLYSLIKVMKRNKDKTTNFKAQVSVFRQFGF
jgi:hypothetical protein